MSASFRLDVAYRSPNSTSPDNVRFIVALIHPAHGCARLCLMGDINLPDLNWELFVHTDSELYNTVADFVTEN
jgi:hypothetical protein